MLQSKKNEMFKRLMAKKIRESGMPTQQLSVEIEDLSSIFPESPQDPELPKKKKKPASLLQDEESYE